ncbi:alpha/beta hydrolase [Glycomyces arizonensis]|uniref:alpha/beta hydrolase n=1 Tax=Glycomyces arizonensis TaxID=256035 RepID=UPI0003FD337D|nr:alpha/beta hydrolase [Glycomyces arizonensis]
MSSLSWRTFYLTGYTGLDDAAAVWDRYISEAADFEATLIDGIPVLKEGAADQARDDFDGETADLVRGQARHIAERFLDDLDAYASHIKVLLQEAKTDFETKRDELAGLFAEKSVYLTAEGEPGEERFEVNESDLYNYLTGSGTVEPMNEYEADAYEQRVREQAVDLSDRFKTLMDSVRELDDQYAADFKALNDDPPPLPPYVGSDFEAKTAEYLQEQHQDFLDKIESGDAIPEEVNDWWNSLAEGDQELFVHELPELVGPVDGIPTEDRDTANRILLDQEIADFSPTLDEDIAVIEDRIAEIEGNWSEIVANGDSIDRAEELEQLREELARLQGERVTYNELVDLQSAIAEESPTGQQYYLLGYDSAGDGKAIVSVGNPDTADNTVVYVPGTGGDLDGAGGNDLQRAETMAGDAAQVAGSGETAVMVWLDYDAPNNPIMNSPSLSYAEDASEPLASFMSGLDATNHDPEETTTTVIGHSYGTTVIGQAASEYGLDTDQIVAVASPGMTVDHASELGIDPDDFYSTTAPGDLINAAAEATLILGSDPNDGGLNIQGGGLDSGFGGTSFDSDNMGWSPVDIHSNYWDDGNPARKNMAMIFTGNGDQVT